MLATYHARSTVRRSGRLRPRGIALVNVGSRRLFAAIAFVIALAATPAVSLIGHPGAFLADHRGELPVKLWVHETFAREGIFGTVVRDVSWPNPGPLNNPDPVGTVITKLGGPILGRAGAYNLLVELQLLAAGFAAFALALDLVGDALAAVTAAAVFGLAPLVLTYCVGGSVTDVLNLWPYPLIFRHGLRAMRGNGRQQWIDAAIAGSFAGIGFISCPYNAVIFVAGSAPAIVWAAARWRAVDPLVRRADGTGRPWWFVLFAMGISAAAVAGAYVLQMRWLMGSAESQMSDATVAATRHAWPYDYLKPGLVDRYFCTLADFLVVGKEQIIVRDIGSRFIRAEGPGWVVFALVLCGVFLRRRRGVAHGLWLGIAGFSLLAATGPFLPVTDSLAAPWPCNPAWLAIQWLVPGGNLILEPFRYALVVSFALAIPAAFGTLQLMERVGRWVGVAAPLLIVADLAVLSPVPFPMPVAEPLVEKGYRTIIASFPPGALVMLPYYERGTTRLRRIHFWQQLLHRRPIADQVAGFLPDYLLQNGLTAAVIGMEGSAAQRALGITKPVSTPPSADVLAGGAALAADGFVAIIVEPEGYSDVPVLERVRDALAPLGPPTAEAGMTIYRLHEPATGQ